ncbi:MAG: HAMP domain-containing histidine kinase [Bacteroidetes bacterium]|nr:HAMP domain-containing histidine kinase [Bacteroidota bacterium]
MKKVFPLIVVLITLSVLGIMFIQVQWIKNAIQVKKDQFDQSRSKAMHEIRNNTQDLFLSKLNQQTGITFLNETARRRELEQHFTVQYFKVDEMQQIIQQALRNNGIKQSFEFGVTNIFYNIVLYSDGFKSEFMPESWSIRLTNGNAAQQENLYVYVREPKGYLIEQMSWMILASIIFTAIIIWAFTLTVRTLFSQKKLSEIKSDFINNMTHELKTPLATISLAVDALTNSKVIGDEEKIRYYSAMIKDENKRMNKQVETILQAARIEREEISLNRTELDAHAIIEKTAHNVALRLEEKQGALSLNLRATKSKIYADEVHFSNLIFNLLDNAIKYSAQDLKIEISTSNSVGQMLTIRIKDNGIGMTKETQAHIFEKFYRAHTGNIHDVKGFGLGLSYVKSLVEAHGGRVRVESALGKGTTFIVSLPLVRN